MATNTRNVSLKTCKAIALLTFETLLSQPADRLLVSAVMMAIVGSAAPYVFGWLAVAMPWLCRGAMLVYLGLAAFKAGWQMVNRIRAIR